MFINYFKKVVNNEKSLITGKDLNYICCKIPNYAELNSKKLW